MTRRNTSSGPAVWHLDGGAQPPAKGAFVAVVDGEAAPLFPLDLPRRLRDSVRGQIARQQVETLLQDGLDGLELRVNRPASDGASAALVVAADRAAHWRDRLRGQDRRVTALLPDYLTLPVVAEGWALRVDSEGPRVLARLGPVDGFAAPLPVALAQLRAALARKDGPPRQVYLCDSPAPEALAALLADTGAEVHAGWPTAGAGPDPEALAFNLFRDPAADRRAVQKLVRRWRGPLIAGFAGLAALAAALWIEVQRIDTAARQQRAAATELARSAFVPSGPILNLRLQVGRAVSERQADRQSPTQGAAPLDVFHAAAGVLAQSPARVRRVSRSSGAPLRIELDVSDFAALDRLVTELNTGPIRARVVNSSAEAEARVLALVEVVSAPGAERNRQ
ncbi:type II secretion system protein GspL [Marinovum sp.]|uniref:type II secretion system protein GspL n=1 Tax=Marinovum sp. TaxID=2024839 RepID=UPI003A94A1DC